MRVDNVLGCVRMQSDNVLGCVHVGKAMET
jgi:hypothetical protein